MYPVLKNFGDVVLKGFLIDLGHFFSEKYIENARIKLKKIIYKDFTLSKQKRWIGLFYGFFVLLYCRLKFYGYKQDLYCRFSSRTANLIPPTFVQDNSKSIKANSIKFLKQILETFVSDLYLSNCISFSLSKIATVFLR